MLTQGLAHITAQLTLALWCLAQEASLRRVELVLSLVLCLCCFLMLYQKEKPDRHSALKRPKDIVTLVSIRLYVLLQHQLKHKLQLNFFLSFSEKLG